MSVSSRCRGAAVTLAVVGLAFAAPARAADVAQRLGQAAATAPADFDIYLPLRNRAQLDRLLADLQDPGSPRYHRWLTPEAFAAGFGPAADTIARVTADLAAHGMTVAGQTGQSLHVHASAAAVEAAFATHLSHGRFADGNEALVAEAPLSLTDALARAGATIPQFASVRHRRRHSHVVAVAPDSAAGPTGPYYTADLRQAYDFPSATALSAGHVTIGVLMQGAYNAPDIDAYFSRQGLTPPALRTVNINGGAAYNSNGSVETHLDIQQSAGMAPGAAVVLYNVASLSDADLQSGLTQIEADNTVDLVNMSFGEPEVAFRPQYNGGFDQRPQLATYAALFAQGVAQGITFVASSGDFGSNPVITTLPVLSVEHPASDPNVTGVGGTNLVVTSGSSSKYVSESASDDPLQGSNAGVWGSGGGTSISFARPSWQAPVATGSAKFRTVPDVALHMGGCPGIAVQPCGPNRSADYVVIGGSTLGVVGTSASSPDFVGLLALKVALARGTAAAPAGRLGNANMDIYTKRAAQTAGGAITFRHTNISGTNGTYTVRAPYDRVLGAGTVDARKFLGATNLPAAGNPGTASNP